LQDLVGADGGYVYLPTGSTVVLTATERPDAPLRERRAAHTCGGAATVDSNDTALVRYALQPGDTSSAGVFDIAITATYPTGEVLTWPSSPDPPYGLTMTLA
jgi:hypothetical protein